MSYIKGLNAFCIQNGVRFPQIKIEDVLYNGKICYKCHVRWIDKDILISGNYYCIDIEECIKAAMTNTYTWLSTEENCAKLFSEN